MNELHLEITLPSDIAEVCCQAVGFEASHEGARRSDVRLSCSGERLEVEFTSEDLSSLRASLNTYLRLILMCSTLIAGNQ